MTGTALPADWEGLIRDIAGQRRGFRFGRPAEGPQGRMVPILRAAARERSYLTLPELRREAVRISDSGQIGAVEAEVSASEGRPVLVRRGALFGGVGTQSRGSVTTVVLFPGEESEVPVRCVHASHGIRSNAEFRYEGLAPRSVEVALSGGDQSEVWATVRRTDLEGPESPFGREAVGRDDLVGKVRRARTGVRPEEVQCHPDQVGALFLDSGGHIAVEVFDHPDSWKAYHAGIIEARGLDGRTGHPQAGEPDLRETLAWLATAKLHGEAGDARFETYALRESPWSGEVTTLGPRVIHFVANWGGPPPRRG